MQKKISLIFMMIGDHYIFFTVVGEILFTDYEDKE